MLVQGRRPTLKKPKNPKQGKKDITILIKDELQANRQLGERMLACLERFLGQSSMSESNKTSKPSSNESNHEIQDNQDNFADNQDNNADFNDVDNEIPVNYGPN